MNSVAGEALVIIKNPHQSGELILDFRDESHPRRVDSGGGESEVGGFNNEVWLDFDYAGPSEGDVCRPFSTVAAAAEAVANGGVIRVVPGLSSERGMIGGGKRFTMTAPIGEVLLGGAMRQAPQPLDRGGISNGDVWVQFNVVGQAVPRPPPHKAPGGGGTGRFFPLASIWAYAAPPPDLFNSLMRAIDAVADGGTVHIEAGMTPERGSLGRGKRCVLVAPVGGVTIGAPLR
jgi:hypothetical protein